MIAKLRAAPLSLCLLLAACSTTPIDHPPQGPISAATRGAAPGDQVVHVWPARGRERAVILALHGFGDAGDMTFAGAAEYWAERGITVYAPDQRGFGANPSRKRWPGAEALVADATAMAAEVRAGHPGLPLVVVGHSMGGGVALAAADAGMDADALVLAGPAIAGGDALSPFLRAAGWSAAAIVPERRWTGDGVVDIRPTDNTDILVAVAGDPRHISDPSSRELYGLVRVMDIAATAAPNVTTPTLVLTGAHDEILSPDQIRSVYDQIPGGVAFFTYPQGWHWLFRDLQAQQVWSDVADFTLSGAE